MADVSELPGLHNLTQRFLSLVRPILVQVGSSRPQDSRSFCSESIIWSWERLNIFFLRLQGKERLLLSCIRDGGQSEVRQFLMSLPEILGHRIDEHFVLLL